ncbi:hypothetical protein [Leisingera caerulea]|uniref:hypothetical protein n=1 Tax=Leisingera caerulea TaxID=506591 RepID=UPI0004840F92|nr:hypothetical protein [Leisingera caerulea]
MTPERRQPGLWETFWHRKSDGYGMREHFPGTYTALETLYEALPKCVTGASDLEMSRAIMSGTEAVVKISDTFISAHANGVPQEAFKKAYESYLKENYGDVAAEAVKMSIDAKDTLLGQLKDRLGQAVGATLSSLHYEASKYLDEKFHRKDSEWHRKNGRTIHPESHLALSGEASPETIGFREGSRIYYSDEMEYIARMRMKIIQESNPFKDDPFQLPLEIRGTYLADKIAAVGLSPKVSTMLPLQEEMGRAAPPEPSPETEGLAPGF